MNRPRGRPWDYDREYDDAPDEPRCHTCGGDGWVDSLLDQSGRFGWDADEPGECPNCHGSGLLKDCTTF